MHAIAARRLTEGLILLAGADPRYQRGRADFCAHCIDEDVRTRAITFGGRDFEVCEECIDSGRVWTDVLYPSFPLPAYGTALGDPSQELGMQILDYDWEANTRY